MLSFSGREILQFCQSHWYIMIYNHIYILYIIVNIHVHFQITHFSIKIQYSAQHFTNIKMSQHHGNYLPVVQRYIDKSRVSLPKTCIWIPQQNWPDDVKFPSGLIYTLPPARYPCSFHIFQKEFFLLTLLMCLSIWLLCAYSKQHYIRSHRMNQVSERVHCKGVSLHWLGISFTTSNAQSLVCKRWSISKVFKRSLSTGANIYRGFNGFIIVSGDGSTGGMKHS